MSTKPIEVGCRVLVVRSKMCPENIGKVAVVLAEGVALEGYENLATKDTLWTIKSLSSPFVVVDNNGLRSTADNHVFSEKYLIRLPDEDEVEEFDKEKELEEV